MNRAPRCLGSSILSLEKLSNIKVKRKYFTYYLLFTFIEKFYTINENDEKYSKDANFYEKNNKYRKY